MKAAAVTDRDRAMALRCIHCPPCRHAQRNQKGLAFWLVKTLVGPACPYCRAYERVYGRKAHEPRPR